MGSSTSTGCVSTGAVSTGAVDGMGTPYGARHTKRARYRGATPHRDIAPSYFRRATSPGHSREHVPRKEREDRQDDDHDRRVLDGRVSHERVGLGLVDRRWLEHVLILLVAHPVTSSRSAGANPGTGPVLARSPIQGPFQLCLVHPRAAPDPTILRLFVELVVGPSAGPRVRAESPAPPRGDVLDGRTAGFLGLAGPGPLLVDGAGRDLLGHVHGLTPLAEPFLDVLGLPLALLVPGPLRHGYLLTAASRSCSRSTATVLHPPKKPPITVTIPPARTNHIPTCRSSTAFTTSARMAWIRNSTKATMPSAPARRISHPPRVASPISPRMAMPITMAPADVMNSELPDRLVR